MQPTQELRDSFKIKDYLYLTKVFEEILKVDKGETKEQTKVSHSNLAFDQSSYQVLP